MILMTLCQLRFSRSNEFMCSLKIKDCDCGTEQLGCYNHGGGGSRTKF